jgi:hypothetical protein
MIFATVPTITLLLFGVGAFDRVRVGARRFYAWLRERIKRLPEMRGDAAPRDPNETDVLLALGFLAAVGPWLLSKTPIFGGTKHWLTAYPFMVIFAGRGFEMVRAAMTRALEGRKLRPELARAAHVALFASVFAAPLGITAHSHPFGLSSYVPIVGGAAGAADLGLNRQFWGFTTQSANVYLEPNAPRGAPVFVHDTAWDSWARMIDERRVRPDLRFADSPSDSVIALVQHELHMAEVDDQIWMAYGTDAPVYVVTHDGVPIVSIYRRPDR